MTKKILVAGAGLISLIYLINPGLGVFEILPDNIPLLGNIDEATATYILLSSLAYFGIDLRWIPTWNGFPGKNRKPLQKNPKL